MDTNELHRMAGRRAIVAALELWGEKFRPMHFEEAAFERYGYTRRQGQREGPVGWTYHHRKRRKLGHFKPLVYSGETQSASEKYRIRGEVLGDRAVGTLSMMMPGYFFQSRKRVRPKGDVGVWVDKPRELRTLLPEELREMVAAAAAAYIDAITEWIEARFAKSAKVTKRAA